MGECTIYLSPKTYADMDKNSPMSGLSLWTNRYGSKKYDPQQIVSLGQAINIGEFKPEREESYQLDKGGFTS